MTLFKVRIIGKFNMLGQWQPEMSTRGKKARMGFLEEVADETAIERKVCTQSQ